jgi:hypothetical protein
MITQVMHNMISNAEQFESVFQTNLGGAHLCFYSLDTKKYKYKAGPSPSVVASNCYIGAPHTLSNLLVSWVWPLSHRGEYAPHLC